MRFSDKSVIVTGGATGIGLAIAERFASEGAMVTIVGRRANVGLEAESHLKQKGYEVSYFQCDISNESEVEQLMTRVMEKYGKIDILINNAAISSTMAFMEDNTEKWHQVFDVTVNGTYFCSRKAAARMIQAQQGGQIINVSSINGYRALDKSSHYNAGKGAMDQLTRCMALELAEFGIRVNGVAPGFIETPLSFVDGVNEHETDWFKSVYVGMKKIPVQRQGQPEEISGAVAFLASADASYICGAIIPIDGGLSITF